MTTEKEKRDAWEAYGEYFKKRTANDVMAEYREQRDEWRECEFDSCGKDDDGSWEQGEVIL